MVIWAEKTGLSRRDRLLATGQLPVVADLLASALRAGATPELAAFVVGAAVEGPVGLRLVRVSRALRLGIRPEEAWQRLSDIPDAQRLVRVAVRSAESGIMLARSMERLGDDLRSTRVASARAAAGRAGVLSVLPLGLCFLPAFLLTGVVPVVFAIMGDLPT